LIPNSVCLIRGSRHRQEAQRLVDYLLSGEVETKLAQGPSAQLPLGRRVTVRPRVQGAQPLRPMPADFAAAAESWDAAARFLRDTFTAP
jgi:iron(III) transport system substrate-binding protein